MYNSNNDVLLLSSFQKLLDFILPLNFKLLAPCITVMNGLQVILLHFNNTEEFKRETV